MIKNKLALGTVQFGLDYGISNTDGKTTEEEVRNILQYALAHNIGILDTALAYGDSENVLGRNATAEFNIVSKFPAGTTADTLSEAFQKSLQNLQRTELYGYIAHNAADIIENPDVWQKLVELKEEGKVKKIGYSLYAPEDVDRLLTAGCVPDLVQVPYNILDDKFETSLSVLKGHNVEIHIRSVYLQGLFFMASFPEKLQPLSKAVNAVKDIAANYSMSTAQLLLNYVLHHPAVSALVIGVNNKAQLEQNLAYIIDDFPREQIYNEVKRIEIPDKHLLNPVNWK